MKRLNVVVPTPTFFPVRGGAEQVIYELCMRMSKKHKMVIVTPRIKGAPKQEMMGDVKIYRFPTIRLPLLNMISANIMTLFYLPWVMKKEKIDLIHQYHIYQMGAAVAMVKKFMKKPLITYLIGWDTYDPIRPVPKVFWPMLRFVYRNSNKVITSCQSMLRAIKKHGCKKDVALIPHGSFMYEVDEKPDVKIRERYNIPKDKKIVFSLQRLFPRKGLQYLVKAMPIILAKHKNVQFIIGGKGPERPKLEKLAEELGVKDNLIFAGFIPDDELKNYYAQSDLYALPSLYEGFGVVYVDSLCAKTPIVTTKCGGPEDIVTPETGILVEPGDEHVFADAIITALGKEWDPEKILARSRKYEWRTVIQQYSDAYDETMQSLS